MDSGSSEQRIIGKFYTGGGQGGPLICKSLGPYLRVYVCVCVSLSLFTSATLSLYYLIDRANATKAGGLKGHSTSPRVHTTRYHRANWVIRVTRHRIRSLTMAL